MKKVKQIVIKLFQHQAKGILMVELIIAIALFAILATGAIYFLSANVYNASTAADRTKAVMYLQEGIEAVQAIDRAAWNYLADTPDNEYGIEKSGSTWELVSDPDNPNGDTDYTRTIIIEDVYRNDSNEIVDIGDSEAVLDPHTRFITVTIEWSHGPVRNSEISSSIYLTDWDASEQTDDTVVDFNAGTLIDTRVSEIDDGEIQIKHAPMEVGTVTATTSWTTVSLDNEYTNPVVITSILDGNNPNSPVSSRVKDATTNSFDVRLDFPPDNFAPSSTNSETVYYIVIEEGTWNLGDGNTQIEAGIIEDVSELVCSTCGTWNNGTDVDYQLIYASDPIVFHQIVTENDSTWITSFVSDDTTSAFPPGTDGFQLALNGAEATTSHSAEDIAYLVVESEAQDVFEGINFESDATGDIVLGHNDTHHTETLDQTYSTTPWAIVTQMTMDGGNGGWSMLDEISTTDITMYVDEDQTYDNERNHTDEDFGYFVLGEEGTYYVDEAEPVYDYPTMEVGIIEPTRESVTAFMEIGTTTASTSWSTINLTNTYINPVVITSILDGNNPNSPVSSRVKDATTNSFDVRLDFPPDHFAPSSTNSETIYYMVVETGSWLLGDGETKIEAGIEEDVAEINCNTCVGGWTNGVDKTYQQSYSSGPLVFHQIMSENDSDWITSFVSDDDYNSLPPGTDGFQLAMNAAQVTTTHDPEDIGYVVIQSDVTDQVDGVDFETDKTADIVQGYLNTHYTESFDQTYSSIPWVLATSLEQDGADGSWIMIDNVTNTDITIYEEEDQTYDSERSHTTETTGFIAFANYGSYELSSAEYIDPVIVNLQQTYTNPVVIALPYFENDTNTPVSIRIFDVTSNSFSMRYDFPTDNFNPVDEDNREDVHYIVMEAGQWQMGNMKVEAHVEEDVSTVAYSASWTGEAKTYSHNYHSAPMVLHQVMSDNDTDWITSWVSHQSYVSSPPSQTGFQIALNAAQVTPSITHAAEDIGWIAFENAGTDTYDGVEYRTAFGNDVMWGHDNGCYTYTHGGTYSDAIVLASQMGMDGSDGSWISMCELTSTTAGWHAEEDQYNDSERSHTSEDYAAIIFEQAFDVTGTENLDNNTSGTFESDIFGDGSTERNYNIIEWTEDTDCENCDITIQVRSADSLANLSAASYIGPDGTTSTYFENPEGDLIFTDSINDVYFQYFANLTGTNDQSPILEDVTISLYEN